jgi:RNA polymerase subunit RPABC4/transcription elongation factor Spt4/F0F1-type ATP synthase membrane subunit c/vacuolar-type H+-ATPase subunit K
MTLPANLNVYLSAALFVVGAYVAALYVGLIVWTFRDIHSRSNDMLGQILATLLVAVFTIPGLVVYLLLRPHTTLSEEYDRNLTEEAILQDLEERRVCPNCQHRVDPDYIICPSCHYQLRLRCVGCGRLLNPQWEVCPYCGLYREQLPETQETGKGKGKHKHAHGKAKLGTAQPEPTLTLAPAASEPPEPLSDSGADEELFPWPDQEQDLPTSSQNVLPMATEAFEAESESGLEPAVEEADAESVGDD